MPTIDPNKLNQFRNFSPTGGTELTAELKTKTVDNDVSVIRFFEKDAVGQTRGFLIATPSPVEDIGKKAKVLEATPEQLDGMKGKPEAFATWLKSSIDGNKAYLFPTFGQLEGAPTRYKFNNIIGQRVDQVLAEATKLATELYPAGEARNKALFAVNTSVRDLYDRPVTFDNFEINGYASFGHDATFLHAYEAKLAELNKLDLQLLTPDQRASVARQKSQIQGEIDAIFKSKYVYESSNMMETDAEKTIGLIAIDAVSRQRISEVESTRESIVPKFEILNVQHEGQNKAVYYDADEKGYFFDRTTQKVPDALIPQIQRKALTPAETAKLTFRRAESGEQLRDKFRFDWNGDGYVQNNKIDWVSWGGHCNDKAALEAAGVVVPDGHKGVFEYNSASGSTVHYDRNKLNEMLLSFSELGSDMSKKTGGKPVSRLGTTEFASARDDDRPDRLDLGNGREIPLNGRPNEFTIGKITKDGKTYNGSEVFREFLIADDKMSASKNPLYKNTSEGDYVNLDLNGAVVEVTAKVQVFDEATGYPKTVTQNLKIDFANPPAEPVLVDSVMADPGKREMYEIKLDVKNKKWMYQKIRMEKQPDGSFKKVDISGQTGSEGFDPKKLVGRRETSLDNPSTYLPFTRGAQKTGVSATAETADGSGVWNGRLKSLTQALEKREGEWERVRLDVSARYGSNTGRYLAKLDAKGEAEFYVPLDMPADFWWRQQIAFAGSKDGLVNSTALERGVVTVEGGQVRTDAIDDMLEVLHCAFSDKNYSIVHAGKRFFFDTKEAFDAAVAELETQRGQLTVADPVTPGPTPVNAEVIKDAGSLAKGALKQYTVKAEADGPLTINLNTIKGDADLYLKVGGPATNEDRTLVSWNSGTAMDTITIEAKKGETYGIAVHGWEASDFEIVATGPSVGGTPVEEPTPLAFHQGGVVKKNEEQHFTFTATRDGEIDVQMTGSGDADVYLKVGSKPTKNSYDFRPYLDGSNESGKLKVKKGDVVYGMVRGYSASSEYDLNVTG
jgi:hypothetical protein